METVEELKARKAWLQKQVDACDRAIEKALSRQSAPKAQKPAPQELPGMPPAPPSPPRQPSEHEVNHQEFQTARRERFAKLGVDFVPDEQNTAAFIVVTMKRLRDACRDDDELFRLFDAYLKLTWPANPPRDWPPGKPYSPHPFRVLGSQRVYGSLLEELRAPVARAG